MSASEDGVPVVIGGRAFRAAALTLGDLRRLQPHVAALGDAAAPFDRRIEALCALVLAGLKRHQPELTAAELEELLDLSRAAELASLILGRSGLVQEADAMGEAQAGSRSPGAISTASSPPAAAGASPTSTP